VHRYVQGLWLEGRSTGQSTDPESELSGSGPGQPDGRPARESSLGSCRGLPAGRPPGHDQDAVDRPALTVKNMTVDRSTDRSSGLQI